MKNHSFLEQEKILDNYFKGLRLTFPEEFQRGDVIFFKTVGFGAVMNLFEEILNIATEEQHGFAPKDVQQTLRRISDFDFAQWRSYGTGNKAEVDAAQDMRTDLLRARVKSPSSKKLRLD